MHSYAGFKLYQERKLVSVDKYIFYGAGSFVADYETFNGFRSKYEPLCFCDKNAKPGQQLHGLPVYPPKALIDKYPDTPIVITVDPRYYKLEIQEYLVSELGVAIERVEDYEPYEKTMSCFFLEQNIRFHLNGWNFCCGDFFKNKSPFLLCDNDEPPQEWVERLASFRESIIKNPPGQCVSCSELKVMYRRKDKPFLPAHFLAFTWKNGCNLRCFYCEPHSIHRLGEGELDLNKRMSAVSLLNQRGFISNDTCVSLASGEFTLFSRRKELLEAFKDYPLLILSNCVIFDELLADRLAQGRCTLNCSVDAGTVDTYIKVKGVDCYKAVCENLVRYSQLGAVELKYIFVPGINDSDEDLYGFVRLCKEVMPETVLISRLFPPVPFDGKALQRVSIFKNALELEGMNIKMNYGSFTQAEISEAL